MDKVKDLILYQVATNRNYKVGETFVFDKNTKNGQYEKVFNSSFIDGNTRFCDKLYKISKSKFKRFKKSQLFKIAHSLDTYDVILRDLALEDIRKNFYPDYPSRFHSMYLVETIEQALNYFDEKATVKDNSYQLVAVKLNGIIFRAGIKECLVGRCGQSYTYYLEKAKAYWTQDCPKNQAVEVLFEGKAEIVEILKETKP